MTAEGTNGFNRLPKTASGWIARYDALIMPGTIWLASRAFVLIMTWLAVIAVPVSPDKPDWIAFPGSPMLDGLYRFDAGWYSGIVQGGYNVPDDPDAKANIAFFPAYPLAIQVLSHLGLRHTLAGLIISNFCFLGALLLLYQLCRLKGLDRATGLLACTLLAFAPSAFFFSWAYTESLFLLCVVGSFLALEKRWWLVAGAMAGIASGTRVTGVLLFGVIGLTWLNLHGWSLRHMFRSESWAGFRLALIKSPRILPALCLSLSGLLAYMLFLHLRFGDALVFVDVQNAWDRVNEWPFQRSFYSLLGAWHSDFWAGRGPGEWPFPWRNVIDLFMIGLAFIGTVFVFRRLGEPMGCYVLLGLLIPLSSHTDSMMRYIVVLFPLFMALATLLRSELSRQIWLIASAGLMVLLISLASNWYFVA